MVTNVFPGPPAEASPIEGLDIRGAIFRIDWSRPAPYDDQTDIVRFVYQDGYIHPDGDYRYDIVIVDLLYDKDSGGFTRHREVARLDAGYDTAYTSPQFSPDGAWLAYHRVDIREDPFLHNTIWLSKSDGTELRPLIWDDLGSAYVRPVWSPDGQRLAFLSNCHGSDGLDIYIATFDPDTPGMIVEPIERLASGDINEVSISWSPDGEQICYHFMIMRGRYKYCEWLQRVVLATGERFDLGLGRHPDWSPMDLLPLP